MSMASITKSFLLSTAFLFLSFICFSQALQWYNPLSSQAVKGRVASLQAQQDFGRLPLSLQEQVREAVWDLGKNAAGLYIDFKTDADTIVVRYAVAGALNMAHMPTTGVSGVDLYIQPSGAKDWQWAFGTYRFRDTVTYRFENIGVDGNRLFRLYLPLYNTVKWMEIGVKEKSNFQFVNTQNAPIVVYGTSIAQGACASRPGMGWTNILNRQLNRDVINLGFSGNGRLEQPILDLITEVAPAAFVLDCLPNLGLTASRSVEQLDSILTHAVRFIRERFPKTPIILSAHSSAYTPGFLNKHTIKSYNETTDVGFANYKKLKKQGLKNIYWLSAKDMGLDLNSTVDYAHPNDLGMQKMAEAYQKILKKKLPK